MPLVFLYLLTPNLVFRFIVVFPQRCNSTNISYPIFFYSYASLLVSKFVCPCTNTLNVACLHFIVVFLYFIAINILFSCFLWISQVDSYLPFTVVCARTYSFDGNNSDARVFFLAAPSTFIWFICFHILTLDALFFSFSIPFVCLLFDVFFCSLFISSLLSIAVHCQIIAVKIKTRLFEQIKACKDQWIVLFFILIIVVGIFFFFNVYAIMQSKTCWSR